MRITRWISMVALLWLATTPAATAADSPYPTQLSDLVTGIRAAVSSLPTAQRTADDLDLLRGPIARLEALTLRDAPVPLEAMTRSWGKGLALDRRYLGDDDGLKRDARELLLWWHEGGGRDRVKGHAPSGVFTSADQAVEAYNDELLDDAIRLVQRRLDRYEVKYGPGSPKLNFVEVGLNALAQSWGWFRPNRDGPSPNEILAGYSTSWATVADDQPQAVSALELGWRRYNLNWREGAGLGWHSLLRPRYLSLGVAVAEERDGALRWPLNRSGEGGTRLGPFLTVGDLKVAYLFGPESRLLVSRQVQLLPNLF